MTDAELERAREAMKFIGDADAQDGELTPYENSVLRQLLPALLARVDAAEAEAERTQNVVEAAKEVVNSVEIGCSKWSCNLIDALADYEKEKP